jgi:ABC-type multidrug transport system ATPase subunit
MNALEVRNLSKSFGTLKAVDNASFYVPQGSVFGLIGRNGAGKTTTIRMMDTKSDLLNNVNGGLSFKYGVF